MKLTDAQRTALEYFRAIADKAPRKRLGLDPRTLTTLLRRGLLEHVAGVYGGQHRITEAGRSAIA